MATSILGEAVRITRLSPYGGPVLINYVFRGFVSFKFTPQYTGGDLVGSRNGSGLISRRIRLPTTLNKVDLELVLCGPQIRTSYELQSGEIESSSAYAVGYAPPDPASVPTRDVALEVWSRSLDSGGSVNGYVRWLFPYVNLMYTGDTVIDESTVMVPTFTGWGRQNSSFGAGIDAFWAPSATRAWQYRHDVVLPIIE